MSSAATLRIVELPPYVMRSMPSLADVETSLIHNDLWREP